MMIMKSQSYIVCASASGIAALAALAVMSVNAFPEGLPGRPVSVAEAAVVHGAQAPPCQGGSPEFKNDTCVAQSWAGTCSFWFGPCGGAFSCSADCGQPKASLVKILGPDAKVQLWPDVECADTTKESCMPGTLYGCWCEPPNIVVDCGTFTEVRTAGCES